MFSSQAWQVPFRLSTSQTPTLALEYGTAADFDYAFGSFCPACSDGYGVSYIIMGDDRSNMELSLLVCLYVLFVI